ncbi:MAG: AAA family ATPase [Candidatus Limnocylindrales bacterium]
MTVERARLRSLRLVGFKSFAERTALEFGPGISAVIGPNGSGKSNLADALRWALGEQGRQLRTRRSEDVIFAGSARRHATGMADVTLVLENGDRLLPLDYSEVALGRRLYRSGENEYLLNGQRVRLRDLLDLLDGANLADNAFLFIGQGMVDQALSLRPEERRPLFEEAAGVRRHERRRRQAETQLEEAQLNLARVRDIVVELRPQARRLAVQAEQQAAREDAGEQLAGALVVAGRVRWGDAAERSAMAQARADAARRVADQALRELSEAEEVAAGLLRRLTVRAAEVRLRRDALDAARSKLTELRLAAGRREAEHGALERERAELHEEQAAAQGRIAAARRDLAAAAAGTGPEQATESAESARARSTLEREVALATAELAQLEARHRAAHEEAASLRRVREVRLAEAEQLRRRSVEATQRAEEAGRAAVEAGAAAAAAARDATAVAELLRNALEAEAEAERRGSLARAEAVAADARRASQAAGAAGLRARLAGLQGQERGLRDELEREEMQGLLAAARRRGGRRITEGLEVEPNLRLAVEGALGPALTAVVIGRARIVGLRGEAGHLVVAESGRGQARREAEMATRAARDAGGGPLSEAIRRDPAGVVSRLVAGTVWVPELAAAVELAGRLPEGWQAVTPEGEVARADGLVRLGRPGALLARRADLEGLAGEIAALESEAAAVRQRHEEAEAAARAAVAAAEDARVEAEALRRERRSLEERERQTAGRAEVAAREAAWARAQAERLAADAARAGAALGVAEKAGGRGPAKAGGEGAEHADAAPAALEAWRARLAELEVERDRLAADEARRHDERRAADDRDRRLELVVAMEAERLKGLARRLEELTARDADQEALEARLGADLAAAREGEIAALEALHELDVDELGDRERLAAAEQAAAGARERLRRAEEEMRGADVAAVEARLGLDAFREQLLVELAGLGRLGLLALRPSDDPRALADGAPGVSALADEALAADASAEERLALELEVALDVAVTAWSTAPAPGPPGPPPAEVPSPGKIAALRRRYHEVGASNPFAAEEYAQVRTRLETLEMQQQDLDRAIASTRALIAELSERITEQFRVTFAALEGAFARRFEQLFAGGEAQLVLTEPEDLALTGVEIMARPPGKKRQALAMLSGGERALTAVALLFAMLDVRPVPFCVLDEVDAALDEANVTRFTEALRELAAQTQFVVITHNRGTIEAADALYGITIGDDAVSRVISLRLSEATALAEAVG